MRTALGFRAHSGWAAMVVVAGSPGDPRVLERRRTITADPRIPGAKQPYHAAADLPLSAAETLVANAMASSRALAFEGISGVVELLRTQGHEVAGCGIVLASGRALPGLAEILASHALIHTAEGEMFREILAWAAGQCAIPVFGLREKEIADSSVAGIASLGKRIGPPWTLDQKYATLAGLAALAATRDWE